MPLTPAEAFKTGFLLRCADEGLTPDEIGQRIKQAAVGTLGIGTLLSALKLGGGAVSTGLGLAVPTAATAGIIGVGVPAIGGAATGYALGRASDTSGDELEQAKQEEIEGEYRRLAQEARRVTARKQLQAKTGRKVTMVSPSFNR